MPRADIVIESPIVQSFRVKSVCGMFDVPDQKAVRHEWHVNIPCEERDWKIGLITGPSGSGKTTIGRRLFADAYYHEHYEWPDEQAIVDGFPANVDTKDVVQALSSVGFSSPMHWIKRFAHLSNGQKFRAELARLMLEDKDTVIMDEFTSVVDRQVAQIGSAAISKAIRHRQRPRLIALSCHYDIAEWLNPDWTYDLLTGEFQWRDLRRHPNIELKIHKADKRSWDLFKGHHYLSADISAGAQMFVATHNGNPVAFTSYIHFVHPKATRMKRGHRTVVLPDYQGIGIGNRVSEWMGEYVRSQGFRFSSTTSHPSMIAHRMKSLKWKKLRIGHVSTDITRSPVRRNAKNTSVNRLTASFEYVGSPCNQRR